MENPAQQQSPCTPGNVLNWLEDVIMSGPPGFPGASLPGQPQPMATPPGMPNATAGGFPMQGAPMPPPGAIPLPPFVAPPASASSYGFPPPMHPMLVPPGAGLVPPVMPMPLPTATVPKSTDVYIGKIANTVEDETIRSLLEVCGAIKSWKRAEDPDTHQPKGFGFCEFEEAEGVLRATRLLNRLKIDGQELQARSSTATAKYVDAYQREKAMRGPEDKEEGEHVETEEQKDAKLMEQITKVIEERDSTKQKAKEDVAATKDHESETASHRSREVEPDQKDRRHGRLTRGSVESRSERGLSRDRREMEMLIRDEESAYRKRLQEWESYERRIEKELQRETDIQRALERERARSRRVDYEEDSDEEKEPWARKPYKNTRRAEVRRRRRREEEAWDEADRVREEKENEMKRQKSEEPEDMELDTTPQEAAQPTVPEETSNGIEKSDEEVQPEIVTGGSIALTIQSKKPTKPAASTPAPMETSALKDMFGDEEEEKPRRELRGLAFSEIDTRPTPDPKDAAKNLIETLPKTKDEVYEYSIKWDAYQSSVAGAKIESWLNKKVSEILGFEEASLTSFIMAQLDQHQPPSALEKELAEVLDDEQQTETFIIKLYRTVIYETEKAAALDS